MMYDLRTSYVKHGSERERERDGKREGKRERSAVADERMMGLEKGGERLDFA